MTVHSTTPSLPAAPAAAHCCRCCPLLLLLPLVPICLNLCTLWIARIRPSAPFKSCSTDQGKTEAKCCKTIDATDCIVVQDSAVCPMDRPAAFCSTCPEDKWKDSEIANLAVAAFGALGTVMSACHICYDCGCQKWRRARKQKKNDDQLPIKDVSR